jgi:DNA-binding response OmpR family regulator
LGIFERAPLQIQPFIQMEIALERENHVVSTLASRPTKILVVDDDQLLRRSLKYRLDHEGYAVTTAEAGEQALSFARRDRPDLVLLDIGLPDRDGLEIARTLQREIDVPIILLTGRRQETDIVVGLELGAEDYVTKPFGMRELLARIRTVLRRTVRPSSSQENEHLVLSDISLDINAHEVHVRGHKVDLAPKEFELLRLLMSNAGSVLTTEYLLDAVWGEEFAGASQVLYVHIGWLREAIEQDPRHPCRIVTVRGIGYKLVAGEAKT